MASSYPGSLDSFDSIASDKKTSDVVGGRTHRDMHNDLGDAIEAVQAELGTDPAGTYSTVKARLDALVAYAAKTSAYTATVADHTLNVTSGTFTLDLPAASTCAGQSLKVKNSGTGVVTLDGNSSETVEGVATFPLGPGSYIEITSTGSAWILTSGTPNTGWRDVSALYDGGVVSGGVVTVRRVGGLVEMRMLVEWAQSTTTTGLTVLTLPSGFRPPANDYQTFQGRSFAGRGTPSGFLGSNHLVQASGVVLAYGCTSSVTITADPKWITADAWPTSLPGSAV